MSVNKVLGLPFGTLWRTALVRLPRAVPDSILRITSPDGPHPVVFRLPSRGRYLIPVYAFIPPNVPLNSSLPIILDFHGGGFYLGSCLEQAPFCARLSRELGAVVLSVDYRLGPIDKFPAAIEDGEDVLGAILDPAKPGYKELRKAISDRVAKAAKSAKTGSNASAKQSQSSLNSIGNVTEGEYCVQIDKSRIALSGFSSGGNLALNLALSVPAEGPFLNTPWPSQFPESHMHPIPILLFYPSFDARLLPSERTLPEGMQMTKSFWGDIADFMAPAYLPRDIAAHPRASPGLVNVQSGLHQQARLLLVLPEKDSLAEQSEAWVKKVEQEGRAHHLVVNRYKGMAHGWTQFPESWLSEEEKTTREESFRVAITFVKDCWEKATD